jgi:hypothetical protein
MMVQGVNFERFINFKAQSGYQKYDIQLKQPVRVDFLAVVQY